MKPAIRTLISVMPLRVRHGKNKPVSNNRRKTDSINLKVSCLLPPASCLLPSAFCLLTLVLSLVSNKALANTDIQSSSSLTPPSEATEDCIDLTLMAGLARIAGASPNLINLVETQQLDDCQISEEEAKSLVRWSNGESAKIGRVWYYPNGLTAKYWSGSVWHYPNGKTAISKSNWYYPNGQTAKYGSGWHYPDGNCSSEDDLLSWACSILGEEHCETVLSQVADADDLWQEMAIMELTWHAYVKSNSQRRP
ncbi:MAG: hypothetical protein F6K47_07100 [Symploca sp. SIO2E6]|nr:hypothetical protein [Symploca sp. SIO2E6]